MTVMMFDDCSPGNLRPLILSGSDRVAGYVDGPCQWPGDGWSMFPGHPKVRITTRANALADVYDWEKGTADLWQVHAQVLARDHIFLPSGVYCDQSNWEEAYKALMGLPVVWWVAAWNAADWPVLKVGSKTIRAAAWQYASFPTYDASRVDDVAWPVLGEPAP